MKLKGYVVVWSARYPLAGTAGAILNGHYGDVVMMIESAT